jgi:hypothetical protein
MSAPARQVPIREWLGWFLGVDEEAILSYMRAYVFSNGCFVNAVTGQQWPAGQFRCMSVKELAEQVGPTSGDAGSSEEKSIHHHLVQKFRVIDDCDIGRLQGTLKTDDCAMVQIASNFNCLEIPSRGTAPDYGHLVEGYASDTTQGPASSFGVPAASLYRAHYAFHNADVPHAEWGQTSERSVDLLEDVRPFFGKCVNGKFTLTGDEERLAEERVAAVAADIKVGVHTDAQVVFARSTGPGVLDVVPEPFPLVDQVLSASVNWNSPGVEPPPGTLPPLTRAALRACYEGAYLAAIWRGRKKLLLTLVGGGSFGNPPEMILEEMAAAHVRWAGHPKSVLEEVILCLYPRGCAKRYDRDMKRLMMKLMKE